MPYQSTAYKVFIASPGDVKEERSIVREVLAEWNDINSEKRALVLLPIGWDTHSTPEMGSPAQEIINKRVLKTADILIGVFWTKVGTPTDRYPSGTIEEIDPLFLLRPGRAPALPPAGAPGPALRAGGRAHRHHRAHGAPARRPPLAAHLAQPLAAGGPGQWPGRMVLQPPPGRHQRRSGGLFSLSLAPGVRGCRDFGNEGSKKTILLFLRDLSDRSKIAS